MSDPTVQPSLQAPDAHLAIDSIRDYAIFLLDPHGIVRSWNEGARALKGYEASEIIGHSFTRFYSREDAAAGKPQRLLDIATREGRVEDEGWRYRKDGSAFWADVVITALRTQSGELRGFVKVTRDLTERRSAEQRLRSSEEKLRIVFDTIREYAIFMLDRDGRIASWNKGAERITGYAAADAVGRHIAVLYPPDEVQFGKVDRELRLAVAHGSTEDESWRLRKGGERFWANTVITPAYDAQGQLRGFTEVIRDLTERRRADELLRQSEARMRLLVSSVKDYAIFLLDPDGRISSWNIGAERIKGYKADEIIGRHMSAFYAPEDLQAGRPQMLLSRAMAEGRVEDEGWRVRKDGRRFWADVIITRIDDEAGNLIGFAKVTRDLTARRAAEEALRQGEERLRLMVESVKDYAIFMLDPSGRVTSWNPGATRLKGYTSAEIIGRDLSTFYPEEDVRAGKPARELEIATETGRFEDEGWRVRKDGSRFWANVVLSAVRDDRGQLLGFTKVTRDMTERKRAEEALVQRARQQAAVAQLGLFALEKPDVESVIHRAMEIARETLGTDVVNVLELSPDGASFMLRASTVAGESDVGKRVAEVDRRSQPGYTVLTSEPVQLDRDRFTPGSFLEQKRVAAGITAMIRGSDRPHGAYGVLAAHSSSAREFTVDDVNFLQAVANLIAAALERKRMEEQVRAAEQKAQEERVRATQAREALRERDEFISVAAHELRTPLTALQLKLQGLERVLRTGGRIDATGKGAGTRLEGALRQTERLGMLVERLLDVTRIAGGRLELTPERFDLVTVLRQVADDFREPAAAAGSEIRIEAPPAAEGTWDKIRMEQVLVNLFSNAVKYGGGRPISVRLTASKDRVNLKISDQGIGIAPEDVERIFSRFGRAAPVRNYGGLGLGLYITKHIVESHGGEIQVTSRVGHGATFAIDLPVALLQASEADVGQRRARA